MPDRGRSEGEDRERWLYEAAISARAGDDVVYYQTDSDSFECGRLTGREILQPYGAVDALLDETTTAAGDLPMIRRTLDRAWSSGKYPE